MIEWNEVTENQFYNELKRGSIKVTKTSEDGMVEGIRFHLYGTSLSGAEVNEYAVTNANGVATFDDILIGARYTLEEVDTAEKYIVPAAQTVEIEWNKVTNASFENVLKRGDLKVINNAQVGKIRIEKTSEDGVVEGFTFKVEGTDITGKVFSQEFVTNENGEIIIEGKPVMYLKIGTNSSPPTPMQNIRTLPCALIPTRPITSRFDTFGVSGSLPFK